MRCPSLLPLLWLAAAAGCATSAPPAERPTDDVDRFEAILGAMETLPRQVQRLALRARAGETGEQLAEELSRAARECQAVGQDLASQTQALRADHPGDPRTSAADRRATVVGVKLREAAVEASAALATVRGAGLPQPPATASEAPAAPEAPGQEPDLVPAAAAEAAGTLAWSLRAFKSRPLVVTPAVVEFGAEMPKLGLAVTPRGGESDIFGRVFARRLAEALARAGFKATFTSDVATQLAAAPTEPLEDASGVGILLYGAVALSRGQSVAWDLRAVDLNNDGIVGETQGVYRAPPLPAP